MAKLSWSKEPNLFWHSRNLQRSYTVLWYTGASVQKKRRYAGAELDVCPCDAYGWAYWAQTQMYGVGISPDCSLYLSQASILKKVKL